MHSSEMGPTATCFHDRYCSSDNFAVEQEIRRSYSTRDSNSSVERKKARELRRSRPSTLHIRRTTGIPTVAVHEAAPLSETRREKSKTRGSREEDKNAALDTLQVRSVAQEVAEHSRSVSPRPRTSARRDSMISMLNRIWKSDESTRKPQMIKMAALDVPTSECLVRQMSLSDTNVTPGGAPPTRRIALLTLTTKQKRLLKSSFTQLNSGGTFLKIMEQVFRRLENKTPDIRSIFLTTAFVNSLSRERASPPLVKTEHDHCKCLVDMFERIIASVDDIDSQLPILRQYGEKHAQMRESGFTGAMIEHFGEITVAVIGTQEAVKYNQDTLKAWRLVLAYITDEMKVGFDRFNKRNDRRKSTMTECPYT